MPSTPQPSADATDTAPVLEVEFARIRRGRAQHLVGIGVRRDLLHFDRQRQAPQHVARRVDQGRAHRFMGQEQDADGHRPAPPAGNRE